MTFYATLEILIVCCLLWILEYHASAAEIHTIQSHQDRARSSEREGKLVYYVITFGFFSLNNSEYLYCCCTMRELIRFEIGGLHFYAKKSNNNIRKYNTKKLLFLSIQS